MPAIDKTYLGNTQVVKTYKGTGLVYEYLAPDGVAEFTNVLSTSFTVPYGHDQVLISAIGAGGSGSAGDSASAYDFGGGYAGAILHSAVATTSNTVFNFTLGVGGSDVGGIDPTNGNPGTDTTIDTLVAVGGLGGTHGGSSGFNGSNTNAPSELDGRTVNDGQNQATATGGFTYGGQASSYAYGGNGLSTGTPGQGFAGSGGGSADLGFTSGRGGDGMIRIISHKVKWKFFGDDVTRTTTSTRGAGDSIFMKTEGNKFKFWRSDEAEPTGWMVITNFNGVIFHSGDGSSNIIRTETTQFIKLGASQGTLSVDVSGISSVFSGQLGTSLSGAGDIFSNERIASNASDNNLVLDYSSDVYPGSVSANIPLVAV